MEYEVDKWDLEGSEELFKPLNKKNEKDVEGARDYCDEHEFLYGNHTCEPIWKKNGNLDKYEIVVHQNKKDKLKLIKKRDGKKKKKQKTKVFKSKQA